MTKPFKPMLAAPLDEAKLDKFLKTSPLLITPKLDGIRAVIQSDGHTYGRSLKRIPNNYVQETIKELGISFYDGELIVGSPMSPTVYRDTFSGVMSIEGEPDFTFWVFDHYAYPDVPYIQRYNTLSDKGVVKVLPQKIVKTVDEVLQYEEIFLEQGFEGAMLRRGNAPYKYGRATATSLDLMKIKREKDDESLVLGIYPAMENQNEAFTNELGYTDRTSHAENKVAMNMAGGFILKRGEEEFKCSMGRFNHTERKEIWENRDKIIGRFYVKYRFFEYGVKEKPRHPRALGWRDEVDMS